MYGEALLLEKLEQMIGVGKWRHIWHSEISTQHIEPVYPLVPLSKVSNPALKGENHG